MEIECAGIERGEVLSEEDGGYIVASFDREGIITPPLQTLSAGNNFAPGDRVYFFMFADGTGRVLCGF